MALAGVPADEIAQRLDLPLALVRSTIESPAGRAELRARRRAVLEAVQGAAGVVIGKSLKIVNDELDENPTTDLALAAIGKVTPLLPKQIEVEHHNGEGSNELQSQVSWLLQQADRHRLQLEHGVGYVLDGEVVGEASQEDLTDSAPPPGDQDGGAEDWDLL